jgi:2-polyprenyl-3-methyl-5-hydroxy-6-metoxy-1,4-benzoquinol methylase
MCRHIFWARFPAAAELERYYARVYAETHTQERLQEQARWYCEGHLRELLDWVRKPASEARLADYGCSIPVMIEEAARLGLPEPVGVDLASEAHRYGRERGLAILSPAEFEALPDGSLDIVRFSHVLEHTVDPVAVLRGAAAKVRRGGLVYITQPGFPMFRAALCHAELLDAVYPEHLHFFSPLSLATLAMRAGLEIRRLFTFQKPDIKLDRYGPWLDPEYARARLGGYVGMGDPAWPPEGNYPHYAGENAVLYAFRH